MGLINLLNMVYYFGMQLGLACMTLGIGLESSKERKGFDDIFFFGMISSWLAW